MEEDTKMLDWFGCGRRLDAIELQLDIVLWRLRMTNRREVKIMADLSELKQAWQDVKDDIADAVARLKDLQGRVEDPAVAAELGSIAADMKAVDKTYDDAVAGAADPAPVGSAADAVTGDKLETVYPADDGQPVEGTVPAAPDEVSE